MIIQPLFGSALIVVTVVIHASCFDLIFAKLPAFARRILKRHLIGGGIIVIALVVLGIFAAYTIEIWFWALVYQLIGKRCEGPILIFQLDAGWKFQEELVDLGLRVSCGNLFQRAFQRGDTAPGASALVMARE